MLNLEAPLACGIMEFHELEDPLSVQVAVPQAITLNSHGFYGDCELLQGTNTVIPPKCNVTTQWVPPGRSKFLPYAAGTNPGQSPSNSVYFQTLCFLQF